MYRCKWFTSQGLGSYDAFEIEQQTEKYVKLI